MGHKSNRQVRVRGVRRHPSDVQKLGRALLALAMAQAQAEADAEAAHKRKVEEGRPHAA
jgi:hypothetical protein